MMRNAAAAAAFAALLAATATPCSASLGGSVHGIDGTAESAFVVTASYGAADGSPDGHIFFAPFAFLYKTRGAGWFMQDVESAALIAIPSGDAAGLRAGYGKKAVAMPSAVISGGGYEFLKHAWETNILPCYKP